MSEWAPSRVGVLGDAISDAAVVAIAIWTVFAWIATATQAPVEPFVGAWLAVVVGLVVVAVRRGLRDPGRPRAAEPAPTGWSLARLGLLAGSVAFAAASAAVAAGAAKETIFRLAWIPGAAQLVVVGGLLLTGRRTLRPAGDPDTRGPGRRLRSDFAVLVTGLGMAGLSLFVFRFSPDDVYYVNRAQWISDYGRIPYRDVLLGNGTFPAVGGTGSPTETFTSLQGSLARLFHLPAGDVAYYLLPPLFTLLTVWAVWRLMRCWAIRRPLVCWAAVLMFLFVDAAHDLSFGTYFFPRFSEGKAEFVSWLVPTLFVLLTRWVRDARIRDGALIVAATVAGVGLTASGSFVVPLILATAIVPLLLQRRWPAAGALILCAGVALGSGFVGASFAPPRGFQLSNYVSPSFTFALLLGTGFVAVIGGMAMWLSPWLVRDRHAGLIALGATVVGAVALAPHVTEQMTHVVGVGGALKRVLWATPIPAFAGLLAGLPPAYATRPRWQTVERGVSALLAAALLVALPVSTNGATIADNYMDHPVDHPVWKVPPLAVGPAERIVAHTPAGGVVLAPQVVMETLAIVTGRVKAVDPRKLYTMIVPQPPGMLPMRLTLTDWVAGRHPLPDATLARYLGTLHVGTVCSYPGQLTVNNQMAALGWTQAYRAGPLVCYRNPNPPG